MFIQKDKPLPPELVPLDRTLFMAFADEMLPSKSISQVREQISRIQPEWQYIDLNNRLRLLDGLHNIMFGYHCPKPTCQLTYSRVRYVASFHSEDWSMRFSENFFQEYTFEQTFKTWIHESSHAVLHFSGLRVNPTVAADVLNPPLQVVNLARQLPQVPHDSALGQIARRNLLGMIDHSMGQIHPRNYRSVRIGDRAFMAGASNPMAGTGLDSFYLNVEINVENLTEILFKKVFPNVIFRRSYVTAEEYISRRRNGIGPAFAVK